MSVLEEDESGFRGFAARVALVTAVIVVAALIYFALQPLLLAFAGVLIAIVLCEATNRVRRWTGWSRGMALGAVGAALVILLGGALVLGAPYLGDQFRQLSEQLPASVDELQGRLEEYPWAQAIVTEVQGAVLDSDSGGRMIWHAAGWLSSTMGAFAATLLALFIGICLAIEPRTYLRGLLRLAPIQRRPRLNEVLRRVGRTIGMWLYVKGIAMALVGILTGVALWLLDIPLAFTLALLTALLTFIPNFGPVISAVPPMLLGFMDSPIKMVYVAAAYFGIQMVESYLVTPMLESETLSLPPALTATTQIVFGLLAGFLGLFLATPILAAGIVLVNELYVRDALGDENSEGLDVE